MNESTMNKTDGSSSPILPTEIRILGDVREREVTNDAPLAPSESSRSNKGFPEHKSGKASRFKRKRQDATPAKSISTTQDGQKHLVDGYSPRASGEVDPSIDQENNDRLATMSEAEILQAQQELKSTLGSSIIDTLLRRATTVDNTSAHDKSKRDYSTIQARTTEFTSRPTSSRVTEHGLNNLTLEDRPPLKPPSDLHPVASSQPLPPPPDFHFPKQPPAPELDPDDPDFLEKLHSTYFPSLSADPASLAWMSAPTDQEQAEYSPDQASFAPSSVRFDFRGRLLPPRLSSQVPVTKGLHHHGLAPKSAGYTIPELSRLSRSTVPSQQCIAFQTVGRILFRLGKGEFGQEGDDLYDGLWGMIEGGQVLPIMIRIAANENEGHRSVWATATDAVWLWRKGGGKQKKGSSGR